MFGVVLWSDLDERKAVIWCEDHGDLAFYKQPESEERVALDTGDWVQFDLTMDREMRFAHNPRLVAEGVCAGLAEALEPEPGAKTGVKPEEPQSRHATAQVIPFAAAQRSTARNDAAAAVVG
ncbi:MAG: hypothetical protein ACU0BB_07450 [Paracoccaceae bacterium]